MVVLNLHDERTDIATLFFCKSIPHGENTCNALMALGVGATVYNPSKILIYHDLAYRAHRLGLIHISSTKQLKAAVKLIEQHQKESNKFDVICPDRAILNRLLEISLQMEKLMVPEFFAGPSGERELRSDFEQQAKSSLCSVDISGAIESSNWREFFASLNDRLNSIQD